MLNVQIDINKVADVITEHIISLTKQLSIILTTKHPEIKTRIVEALEMPINGKIINERIAFLEKIQEFSTKKLMNFLDGIIDY